MPLTQNQIDYVTIRTNERGAGYDPAYKFNWTQMVNWGPGGTGLNIVIMSLSESEGQGGSKKGPNGWETDQPKFAELVEDVLTVAERHFGR